MLGRDGQTIDCIHIQAGTIVVLGTASVNRDPAMWGPDADQWIPERWLQPLPETVVDAYLPEVHSQMWVSWDLSCDDGADVSRRMTFIGGGRPEQGTETCM